MKSKIIIALFLLTLVACTQSIQEIKNEEHINNEVSVRGEVEGAIKLGELSGFTLVDSNNDRIFVVSERLPAEGDKVTAKGTLKKNLLGYYIDAKN